MRTFNRNNPLTPTIQPSFFFFASMERQKHQQVFLFCILMINCFLVPSLADLPTNSSSCSGFAFPNNQVFATCASLSQLDSFLHWTYVPSASSTTLRVAYQRTQVSSSTWVAWGINPTSTGMVGTQAIVAYQKPDGTMAAFTSPVDSYDTQLQEGNLSFRVSNLSALFFDNQMVIFAVIQLQENTTIVNHVWQDGPVISGNSLGVHDLSGSHLQSMGSLNLSSGQASAAQVGSSKTRIKIAHGVLNTVSWGIMMPLGFLSARYLKAVGPKTDPLWFYVHIILQLPGFLLGIAGGATGLYLGIKYYSGVHHPTHMYIGMTLLFLGTLQVSALFFRLAKDHKYRYLWNWFHHLTGYAILLLSIANIWIGFYILKPANTWLIAYGVILGAMVVSTTVLEVWKKLTRDRNINYAKEACTREEDKSVDH